jgi:virginiamycin B lyase
MAVVGLVLQGCGGEGDPGVESAGTGALTEAAGPGARACGRIDEFSLPPNPGGIGTAGIVTGSDGNLWFGTGAPFIGRVSPADARITLYPISLSTGNSMAAGTDGNIWFPTANGVATFSPRRHTVHEIPLPGLVLPGIAGATAVTAGPDGAMWVLGLQEIARVTPRGQFTLFAIPVDSLNGGHITGGPDGNVWFTGGGISGLQAINRITRLGVVTRFPVDSPGFVFGLAAGADGALWFTQQGGAPHQNSIGRMTTDGVASTVVQLPDSTSDPSTGAAPTDMPLEITAGPRGDMFYTTYLVDPKEYIGQVSRRGVLTKHEIPSDAAASFGITAGPDGNVWFTENFNALVARLDLAGCHHRDRD